MNTFVCRVPGMTQNCLLVAKKIFMKRRLNYGR